MDQVSFARQRARVVRNTLFAVIVCSAAVAAARLWLPKLMTFPSDLPERLAFGAELSALAALWVFIGVVAVSLHRFGSPGEISGAAYAAESQALAVKRASLQNTLEQSVIASSAYLLHASAAGGENLSVTLCCAILFSFGRLWFYVGYVRGAPGRSFGMATTLFSTVIVYAASAAAILT